MNSQQQSTLRQSIRNKRRLISKQEQQQHSESIIHQLIHSQVYQNSYDIALYLSTDGEVDLNSLMSILFQDNKKVYLPIILSAQKGIMKFAPYHHEKLLEKNYLGILEPLYEDKDLVAIEQLDLILAPLVGFDESGNRIGMGGGYYDRALQNLKTGALKTQFIGVAHELQKVEKLQAREWDIPLHGIITEKRFSYF